MTGETESENFPATAGAFQTALAGKQNAFVSKLNPAGSALVYSTYLGGKSGDIGYGIAVDASGNAYVTGETESENFPTTAGAFQTTLAGKQNTFITKLNPSGSAPVYSTYLGGTIEDSGNAIAVDASGNAYVTGRTYSDNFPTTAGAFQTKFDGAGDAFITKLNQSGSALAYSTYLGGDYGSTGYGIAVDASGNAYVMGTTYARNFPTTAGAFQTSFGSTPTGAGTGLTAFVTKLNPSGSALVYSTYLGGSIDDWGNAIAVDASGNAYVTGQTESGNFPTTKGAFQRIFSGKSDAFIAKFLFPIPTPTKAKPTPTPTKAKPTPTPTKAKPTPTPTKAKPTPTPRSG